MAGYNSVLREYFLSIQEDAAKGNATERTEYYAIKNCLEQLKQGITATIEPKRIECGAPDFSVSSGSPQGLMTIGYVEAKDIYANLNDIERDSRRANPSTREGQQLKRYRAALPNLIFTNYLEFRWYVEGERRQSAELATVSDSKLSLSDDGVDKVAALLNGFLDRAPEPVSRPQELAQRMARLTHMVRDIIVEAFNTNQASMNLKDLHEAFEKALIPDLSIPDFADMFAQTLGYGLFAARVNHNGHEPFRRRDAATEIPRTNPFLRRIFTTIAGPELSDEPFAGFVEDIAQMLAQTDMEAVLADFGKRTVKEDPILHFYETFLDAYDPKIRELRGVYYTPEPVVSYIVRSVDYLLRSRFNCSQGLADTSKITYTYEDDKGQQHDAESHRVLVLDPACGTGTFLYSVVDQIREQFRASDNAGLWRGFVKEHLLNRLFGFELLMAPYAMAHLKLGMQLAAQDMPEGLRQDWAYDFGSDERLGVYLTNTLEQAERQVTGLIGPLRTITDEANAAASVKRDLPVMVVLGNPPYSGHSANASWRSTLNTRTGRQRRERTWIGELIQDYYYVDGQPLGERNPKWLQDDYVKFIRFGQWRIEQTGGGVLAFITNHGYLDNPTFRGMRQQLLGTFTDIYLLDLHGNSHKNEIAPDGGKDENVFDIQQGVTIGIFVKEPDKLGPANVHHASFWGTRNSKYDLLNEDSMETIHWTPLQPASPSYLFIPLDISLLPEYEDNWSVTQVFPKHASTVTTARNHFAMAYEPEMLVSRIGDLRNRSLSDEDVRQKYQLRDVSYWKLKPARENLRAIQSVESYIKPYCYRPFDFQYVFYHEAICERLRPEVMRHMEAENVALLTHRPQSPGDFTFVYCTSMVGDQCVAANKTVGGGNSFQFPLYLYPSVGSDVNQQIEMADLSEWPEGQNGRRPNLSPIFVEEIERRLGLEFVPDGTGDLQETFGSEDVFHYIYAILHAPSYRTRYAEFLKRDFPRVPLTSDVKIFEALVTIGSELVSIHLMDAPKINDLSTRFPIPGDTLVEKGHPRYIPPGDPEPGSRDSLEQGRVYQQG